MKEYIIFNKVTQEVYDKCYNSYVAMCNTVSYKNQYGENVVCKCTEKDKEEKHEQDRRLV